jgi:ABC-2 type transport system ATP-binding protein
VVGPLTADIEAGEVVGLLGLNGAGKTTTLRILACDLLPSAGSVRVEGLDVTRHPDQVRSRIGYLPDVPPLYDEMIVARYLAFAAELHGVSRSRVKQRVASVLDETALGSVQDTPIAALSHGYRQRVGIAQAIVHEPKLVVLDEPSSGLDPVQIKDMRRLVRGLGGQRTVLVSSHNHPEISETCDRLLEIGSGTIVASGTEAELVARFLSGERLEISVRLRDGQTEDGLQQLLSTVPGVQRVEAQRSKESGDDTVALLVSAEGDVRGAVARVLVEAGHELLGLGRSERELENVFARLAVGAEKEAA